MDYALLAAVEGVVVEFSFSRVFHTGKSHLLS